MFHIVAESDNNIVPEKQANNVVASMPLRRSLWSSWRRALTERNTMKNTTVRTQDRVVVSFGLDGVRRKAESDKSVKFTSLLHHVTATLLRESYYKLKKNAAAGVDEETWIEYYEGHWDRIENLRERIHKGSYRAPPTAVEAGIHNQRRRQPKTAWYRGPGRQNCSASHMHSTKPDIRNGFCRFQLWVSRKTEPA